MSQRLKRMADQVQREIADLVRHDIKDPRLTGMVTVSSVKISPDLGYADVYYTVLGSNLDEATQAEQQSIAQKVLSGASGFLRSELGRRIQTRVTPRLRFHYDMVTSHANHMSALIAKAMSSTTLDDEQVNAQSDSQTNEKPEA